MLCLVSASGGRGATAGAGRELPDHLVVTERIPLAQIVDLAATLTASALVIEFIAPDDPMFSRITRGRAELHRDLTPATFEAALRKRFHIVRREQLNNSSRWLYMALTICNAN